MAGAVGAAAELDMPAALEHAVEDGLGQVGSWSTRPHAASGLFVVKTIGR